MEIITVEAGIILTNGYIVIDDSGKTGIIIDAPMDGSLKMLEIIKSRNIKIEAILLTHTHWDHTADAFKLNQELYAHVICHKDDLYRLVNPMKHTIVPLPFSLTGFTPKQYFTDGQPLKYGTIEIEVRHTPGHTEGSVCFIFPKNKVCFTGDTLFCGSIGRTDLPGGSTEKEMSSIKEKLLTLPDNFKVYSGHGPVTSIGNERAYNTYLNDIFM
jgi:glyoxylase-like metal-dependent hydrolase (beta-lactamase superfamily II)